MKNLSIELNWALENGELSYGKYNTDHKIKINNEILLNACSATEYGGSPNNLNPEQSLAAAMSSCHMMTFLALAAIGTTAPHKRATERIHVILFFILLSLQ